jgi:hypothetical protein
MGSIFNLDLQIKKAERRMVPRPKNIEIKKPWDLLEVPTVYWLIMIFVDHGRLAPSLELSHHQFLRAFKDVFSCLPIIGTSLREYADNCQGKILI